MHKKNGKEINKVLYPAAEGKGSGYESQGSSKGSGYKEKGLGKKGSGY